MNKCCNTPVYKWATLPVANASQKCCAKCNESINCNPLSRSTPSTENNNISDIIDAQAKMCISSPKTPRKTPLRLAKLNKNYARN